MNIPEGFTPRGDSKEQPPETYDKMVAVVYGNPFEPVPFNRPANAAPWKAKDGPLQIIAYKVLS